jgi:large subunit ribosomal protein L32e
MEEKTVTRKKKPNFIRQDTNKQKNLGNKWRKPRGLHSKLRLNKKGHAKTPSQGYRGPRSLRVKDVKRVFNVNELEDVKKIIIASTVGLRKKVEIVKQAQEKGIEIINVKDVDAFLKTVDEGLSKKKEVKKVKEEKKKKIKAELEKKEVKKEEKKEEDKKEEPKAEIKDVKSAKIVDNVPKKQQNIHRATAPKSQ